MFLNRRTKLRQAGREPGAGFALSAVPPLIFSSPRMGLDKWRARPPCRLAMSMCLALQVIGERGRTIITRSARSETFLSKLMLDAIASPDGQSVATRARCGRACQASRSTTRSFCRQPSIGA